MLFPWPPSAAVRLSNRRRVMAASPQPSPGPSGRFGCEVSRQGTIARIRVLGDLDMAGAPVLEAEIGALRAAGARSLVVDLTVLQFIDSSGLRCILNCDAASRRDGVSIRLIPGPPAVQRVFELTHTDAYLRFAEN